MPDHKQLFRVLGIYNFGVGMGISMVLLLMEHFYMRYLQTHVQKTTDNGCCALISQVSKGQLISDHEKYFLFKVTLLLF